MKAIFKNWKTTLLGIAQAVITGLFANGKIDGTTHEILTGAVITIGLGAAKDGNKSHTQD